MSVLAWFYWNPDNVVFILPILNRPIVWYGVFFTLGFIFGYGVFYLLLKRYFDPYQELINEDIDPKLIHVLDRYKENKILNGFTLKSLEELVPVLNKYILKESSFENKKLARSEIEETFSPFVRSVKKKTLFICDKITAYLVIATIVGARLFHVFFYEKSSFYMNNPLRILYVWEGGLASHGGAIAIVIAIILFSYKYRDYKPRLDWIRLLDFVCIPALLAGGFIRVGNFFNQEISGTISDKPWAVVFGNPADGSYPVPRHPVTLYEAIFYLCMFGLFFVLSIKTKFLEFRGRSIGLFLVIVFSFRFFIEFFKEKQSELITSSNILSMGQFLSIPLVLLGLYFLFSKKLKF